MIKKETKTIGKRGTAPVMRFQNMDMAYSAPDKPKEVTKVAPGYWWPRRTNEGTAAGGALVSSLS